MKLDLLKRLVGKKVINNGSLGEGTVVELRDDDVVVTLKEIRR